MAEIETAISARITAVADLTDLIGDTRFYADQAQTDEDKPYIVFTVVDDNPMARTMQSDTAPNEALVQFQIIADTFAEAKAIWIQLKAAFKRYRGTSGEVVIQDTFVESRQDRFDPISRVYQRDVDITFFYEES